MIKPGRAILITEDINIDAASCDKGFQKKCYEEVKKNIISYQSQLVAMNRVNRYTVRAFAENGKLIADEFYGGGERNID